MHENSVIRMVGYLMGYYAGGKKPVEPWNLYLNFNRNHQTIKIVPEHFSPDGEKFTPALINQIESIDPGWKVKGKEPVFLNAATKKRIKISNYDLDNIDAKSMLDSFNKPHEETFYSVMDNVFGLR